MPGVAIDASIKQYSLKKLEGYCDLEIHLNLSNNSKSAVRITGIKYKLWFFDFPTPDANITFFDWQKLDKVTPDWELPADALPGVKTSYAPGAVQNNTFDLLASKKQKEWLAFKVTIETDHPLVTKDAWAGNYYYYDCEEDPDDK